MFDLATIQAMNQEKIAEGQAERIAQKVLDRHCIKPNWVRSGEQIFDLLTEAVNEVLTNKN